MSAYTLIMLGAVVLLGGLLMKMRRERAGGTPPPTPAAVAQALAETAATATAGPMPLSPPASDEPAAGGWTAPPAAGAEGPFADARPTTWADDEVVTAPGWPLPGELDLSWGGPAPSSPAPGPPPAAHPAAPATVPAAPPAASFDAAAGWSREEPTMPRWQPPGVPVDAVPPAVVHAGVTPPPAAPPSVPAAPAPPAPAATDAGAVETIVWTEDAPGDAPDLTMPTWEPAPEDAAPSFVIEAIPAGPAGEEAIAWLDPVLEEPEPEPAPPPYASGDAGLDAEPPALGLPDVPWAAAGEPEPAPFALDAPPVFAGEGEPDLEPPALGLAEEDVFPPLAGAGSVARDALPPQAAADAPELVAWLEEPAAPDAGPAPAPRRGPRPYGRFVLGGFAYAPGHQALSGVSMREAADAPPAEWRLGPAPDAPSGTLVLELEGLINCDPQDVVVMTAPGFAPTAEGFTLRITAREGGPFAAAGTYRVV